MVCSWLTTHLPGGIYLLWIVGLVAYLLPGLILALIVEQLSGRRSSSSELLLWSTIISLTLIPGVVYYVNKIVFVGNGVFDTLPTFFLVWLMLLTLLIILTLAKRVESGLLRIQVNRKEFREIALTVIGFIVILVINFCLYRFIPEADSYWYLLQLRHAQIDPTIIAHDSRAFFLTFVQLISLLTKLSPYLILKFGLPLMFLNVIATCYLSVRSRVNQSFWRIVVGLSPLYFPIILQELLISRPQSLVVLALVPALYLMSEQHKESLLLSRLYWSILLIISGVVGLKIHTLMALLILIGALTTLRISWPVVKARPIDSLVAISFLMILLWPWHSYFLSFGDLGRLTQTAFQTLRHGHLQWWFLSTYRNIDGTEIGWPGLSWIFYYGYNLGLFMPLIIGIFIMIRSGWKYVREKLLVNEWPIFVVAALMLLIAEILPRFGLGLLPDRAWLFLALCGALCVPHLIILIIHQRRGLQVILLATAIGSILIGSYLTHVKQGWVSTAEYQAMLFVKSETISSAVFIGQGGSRPAVEYFGERKFFQSPSQVFMDSNSNVVEQYLSKEGQEYDVALTRIHDRQQELRQAYVSLGSQITDTSESSSKSMLIQQSNQLTLDLKASDFDIMKLSQNFILTQTPVYIMYDSTKFQSIYGQRAWWRVSNFYGADTDKFTRSYPLIYNERGVMIWKVR